MLVLCCCYVYLCNISCDYLKFDLILFELYFTINTFLILPPIFSPLPPLTFILHYFMFLYFYYLMQLLSQYTTDWSKILARYLFCVSVSFSNRCLFFGRWWWWWRRISISRCRCFRFFNFSFNLRCNKLCKFFLTTGTFNEWMHK